LGKTVAVSFEESNIKVARGTFKGDAFFIDSTEIVEYYEFDDYLKREAASDVIVTYDFKEAYHGVLSVPILKPRLQVKIIESELRKITKLTEVSFVYEPISESVVENKKVQDIFYFAVSNEVIQDVVGKFYDFNKVVRAVYPSVFSAASLIESRSPEEANMGVISTGEEKIVFFTRKGAVYFFRNYESLDASLSDFDVQNINMTISYCSQNIHINPTSVMLLGKLSESVNVSTMPTTPLASLYKSDRIHCKGKTFNEFFLSIASFFAPKSSNILSNEFKQINVLQSYMAYASKVFIAVSILCMYFLFYEASDVLDNRDQLKAGLSGRSGFDQTYSEYMEKEDDLRNLKPVINFLNEPTADLHGFFIDLADIDINNLKFSSIEASSKERNAFSFSIHGVSSADSYSSLNDSFSEFIRQLKNINGVQVNNKAINLANKSFRVDMILKKAG
jgi:hypothetical protein